MKTKRIPFDIEKAKAGAKVITRCGGHVRLGLYDAKYGDRPLVGVVDDGDGIEVPRFFMQDGRHNKDSESRYDLFIEVEEVEENNADTAEKKIKTRRMTHQELSWWLRDCPEEHREYSFCDDEGVRYFHTYRKDSADKEVEKEYRIRRNGGEWMEPLVEIEEDQKYEGE